MDKENKIYLPRGCSFDCENQKKHQAVKYKHSCNKLDVYNWLKELKLPDGVESFNCVEVRFKNSRKDFYKLPEGLDLEEGDIVAVEASPGHDIGVVTLVGEIVKFQMMKKGFDFSKIEELKKVYRKAKPYDIEKWCDAIELEEQTMFRSRAMASDLKLDMKISDVEYQGDKTKAIFYYTADDRVDFRELIKVMADEFLIRIEMKQIGVRQEASRLGGIGSCGRELCCSTWLTNFTSVSTNAARMQQLSLNPHKLAGQCSKLKCCLNYEYNFYEEALKSFPSMDIVLKTKRGNAIHQKTDIFKKTIWYAYEDDLNFQIPVHADDVRKIVRKNQKGEIPKELPKFEEVTKKGVDYHTVESEDSIFRFDNK